MLEGLREAWRATPPTPTDRRSRAQRLLMVAIVGLAFACLLALAPLTPVQVGQLLALTAGVAGIGLLAPGAGPGRPALLGLVDVVAAGVATVIAPSLLAVTLGLVLVAVVRSTSQRGFWGGLPVLLVGEVSLLVGLVVAGTVGPWLPFVMLAHLVLGVAMLLTVGVAVDDRDRVHRVLNRIDDALAAFADTAVEHSTEEAVERAVRVLLPEARVVSVSVGPDEPLDADEVERFARRSGAPLVRLQRAAGGRGPETVVAVPLRAAETLVGAMVLRMPQVPDDEQLRSLDVLTDRLTAVLLADAARLRERDARLRLEAAERLRDEVLARVTHDLRAPLTTISGTVFTLMQHREKLTDRDVDELYGLLSRNADRVTNWVQSLLEGAMSGNVAAMDPRAVRLTELLDEGTDTATEQLDDHRLVVRAPAVTVRADATAVTRVLANLLGNAAKYAPSGSDIEVLGHLEGDEVVVEVVDHGPGMSEEDARHVFEPFFRAADQPAGVKGTGLGLATVRDLVLAWGGRVGVRTTDGGGATFWFTLPLPEDDVLDLDAPTEQGAVDESAGSGVVAGRR